jgi:hypothetical protein
MVISAKGGQPVRTFKVSGGIGDAHWSPDGKALQYLLTRNGATNIWEQSLAGGESKQLTKFTSGLIFDFNWSSDHIKLLLTRGSISSDVILLRTLHLPVLLQFGGFGESSGELMDAVARFQGRESDH